MLVARFIERYLSENRELVASLTPLQRFACDLRSISRVCDVDAVFSDIGRPGDAEKLKAMVERAWERGSCDAIDIQSIRGMIPDADEIPGRFIGAAQLFLFQVQHAYRACNSESLDEAVASVESSLETVYMYVREAADDDGEGDVKYIVLGHGEHLDEQRRWLPYVEKEAESRTADMVTISARSVTAATFASLRRDLGAMP